MKDSDNIDAEFKKLKEISDDEYIYRLVGVNIHVGTANHGHYYSIINIKRGKEEPYADENEPKWLKVEADTWKEFNDNEVKPFNFNADMKKEAFGGD